MCRSPSYKLIDPYFTVPEKGSAPGVELRALEHMSEHVLEHIHALAYIQQVEPISVVTHFTTHFMLDC